ncbi:MAG: TROVE domain-containing protein [Nanoarchaeota archaeon]
MARFNTTSSGTKTTNLAGGEAYAQTPELELVSILLTSFVQDQFYRSANDTMTKISQLLSKVNPKFAAKAAVYARNEFKMRSITHVLAGELAKHVSGQPWAKNFYNEIAKRPDDMTEIISYYFSKGNKKLPNSLKKGFAKAFDKFDAYQLAKYRGENKDVTLVDLVNLVHPVPTDKNEKALKELIDGVLKSTDTWESKMTKAGQESSSEKEKAEMKAQGWYELLSEKKLGAMALVRNLRNILEQSPESIDLVIKALENENYIKNSMLLPFRFIAAINELEKVSYDRTNEVIMALNVALDNSLSSVPKFEGKTLVVLDDSGSMTHRSTGDYKSPMQIGSLFASVLMKVNKCDFIMFADNARYVTMNLGDSLGTLTKQIMSKAKSGGTNFHSIFQTANKAYDRIIILSDMQGWMGYNSPASTFNEYKKKTSSNPRIYSFDLQNYGTMQFPENNVFAIAGFSESVFDIMKMLEQDKKALVKTIENYTQFED